jgi:hypothetical protein
MKLRTRLLALALMGPLAIAALGSGRTAQAGYLATDLGTGGTYNVSSGYTLSGPQATIGTGYSLAVEFTVSGTQPIAFGSAQLALQYHSGVDALTVMLMTNSKGLPGSTLESIQLSNIPTGPSLVTATSTVNTLLTPGTEYWLVAVASQTTYMTWMMNNQGKSNDLAYEVVTGSGPQGWQADSGGTDVAFSISTTAVAVPSPSTASLLGVGLLTVGGVSARRRRTKA